MWAKQQAGSGAATAEAEAEASGGDLPGSGKMASTVDVQKTAIPAAAGAIAAAHHHHRH